ncbi:MAG TPA: hypothetical protein VGF22_22485 [Acidimicrobiales bacterium]
MSPDDLAAVDRSWVGLQGRREPLLAQLEACFAAVEPSGLAAPCARWLVDAVDELVGLLTAPSRLGERARQLAETWPVTGRPPTFAVEGRAWMAAAREVCPSWSAHIELAWQRAWLLLSEELAEESLSPFAAEAAPSRT